MLFPMLLFLICYVVVWLLMLLILLFVKAKVEVLLVRFSCYHQLILQHVPHLREVSPAGRQALKRRVLSPSGGASRRGVD